VAEIPAERGNMPLSRYEAGRRHAQVDRHGAGLRNVPVGVGEHLNAVALRIAEVDRPCDAVSDRPKIGGVAVGDPVEDLLHRLERAEIERQLLDHVPRAGVASGDEHDLMMILGAAAQEGRASRRTRVGHHEAEHAAIEIHHPGHVADKEAHMAQSRRTRFQHVRSSPLAVRGRSRETAHAPALMSVIRDSQCQTGARP